METVARGKGTGKRARAQGGGARRSRASEDSECERGAEIREGIEEGGGGGGGGVKCLLQKIERVLGSKEVVILHTFDTRKSTDKFRRHGQ